VISRKSQIATLIVVGVVACSLSACAPEVGSERWCSMMQDKPRGDWTANEALDFGRFCLFDTRDGE